MTAGISCHTAFGSIGETLEMCQILESTLLLFLFLKFDIKELYTLSNACRCKLKCSWFPRHALCRR